jgi:hypothetical protein
MEPTPDDRLPLLTKLVRWHLTEAAEIPTTRPRSRIPHGTHIARRTLWEDNCT